MNKRKLVGERTRKEMVWIREGECIRCTSHVPDKPGYPRIRRAPHNKAIKVARLLLMRRLGCISPAVVSRHTCDNTWCINPNHIISGTQAQNVRDCVDRGRTSRKRGEDSPRAKLTSSQVLQIREAVGKIRHIAKRFGTSETNVASIRNRKRWRHL